MKKLFIIILTIAILLQKINSSRLKRSAVGPIWPSLRIPYSFSNQVDFDIEQRAKIEHILFQIQSILSVANDTCIQFTPREQELDYILFMDNGDCSSSVGYAKGINKISLSKECITTEVVMHEIMHRLGFDHEHSRHDRDKFIDVNFNNIVNSKKGKNDFNFEINTKTKYSEFELSPYDFFSITHYNSDALQKSKNQPTIVSKIPALLSKNNQIEVERRFFSAIDIIQVQSLYNCKKMNSPKISKESSVQDTEHRLKQSKRFEKEAAFLGLDKDLIQKYLNKTYDTCGLDHFWPADYPLVESNHKHYQYICVEKKNSNGRCLFSLECSNDEAVCNRPFFKKRGWCINTGYDDLNKINQKINDEIMEKGKVIKDTLSQTGNKIKEKWDKFDGKKFQDELVEDSIVVKDKVVETSKKVFNTLEEAGKAVKDSLWKIFG